MGGLIRYAGYDGEPLHIMDPQEVRRRTEVMWSNKRRHALRLFRQGADTLQIAEHMGRKEHTILRWITEERNREYETRNAGRTAMGKGLA